MKTKTRIVLIFLWIIFVISLNALSVQQVSAKKLQEPAIPTSVVFRPEFETKDGVFSAGTAFAIKMQNEENPIIITALHLFGPAGGLEKNISARELPSFVSQVLLYDLFDGSYIGHAKETIFIPDAKPFVKSFNTDVAAFVDVSAENLSMLILSDKTISLGEPVWLLASVYSGEPSHKKLHKAMVVESNNENLIFLYENSEIDLTATSGAPILNKRGEVVGINISGGMLHGKLYGAANPASSIKKLLEESLSN